MDDKFVAKKLIEHDERFDRLEAKVDSLVTSDQFLTVMDKLTKAVDRLDQERLFQIHRIDRHEEDITKIKTKVGLS